MLPSFICPGVQKSGTSILHDIFSEHPDVFLPAVKETFFFSQNYRNNGANALLYESRYFSNADCKIAGEFCPQYMSVPESAKRMYDVLGPDLKIIISLRQPVDRAFSAYQMMKDYFLDTSENFEQALANDVPPSSSSELDFLYIKRGQYYSQIQDYLKLFPRENVKFLLFEEDIKKNLRETVVDICDFLDLNPNFNFSTKVKYSAKEKSKYELVSTQKSKKSIKNLFKKEEEKQKALNIKIRSTARYHIEKPSEQAIEYAKSMSTPQKPSQEFREKLMQEHFVEDIQKTQDLIGRDLSIWLK